jgi:hypothetical protein
VARLELDRLGQTAAAVAHYEDFLASNTDDGPARAHAQGGRDAEALYWFQRSYARFPSANMRYR